MRRTRRKKDKEKVVAAVEVGVEVAVGVAEAIDIGDRTTTPAAGSMIKRKNAG